MSPLNFTHILTQAVDELSESESYKGLFHQHTDGNPLPSAKVLRDIIELARAIIFPGYFGNSTVNSRTVTYHIGVNVERLFDLLTEQILAGLCFAGDGECNCCTELQREEAALLAAKFISNLPAMRRTLATDVEAAYNGDPAHSRSAKSSAAIRPSAPSATTASHTSCSSWVFPSFPASSPRWRTVKRESISIQERK